MSSSRNLLLPEERDPLRVMFVITCMPVGGAETLLVNLVRRMDRDRFQPELCCLKYLGPLGEMLAAEIPTFTGLLAHKYDFKVLSRLTHLLEQRDSDAVVTVGTGGDKMFWGRLAAWRAGVPVILSALHSTGLPDHVEWPNRLLRRITDGFIGVADAHGRYLAEKEGCPFAKVFVIPNGVDVERFQPRPASDALRAQIGVSPYAPVAGIVAALRPEKNHELFLRVAARVREVIPEAQFLVIGDGPRREMLKWLAVELDLGESSFFLGTRADIPDLLALVDVHVLTSHMEANPVSILEAMACGKPNVAPRVGSIPETLVEGKHGLLANAEDEESLAARIIELMLNPLRASAMGRAARQRVVENYSLERMVEGYQELIERLYRAKCGRQRRAEDDACPTLPTAEEGSLSTEY